MSHSLSGLSAAAKERLKNSNTHRYTRTSYAALLDPVERYFNNSSSNNSTFSVGPIWSSRIKKKKKVKMRKRRGWRQWRRRRTHCVSSRETSKSYTQEAALGSFFFLFLLFFYYYLERKLKSRPPSPSPHHHYHHHHVCVCA